MSSASCVSYCFIDPAAYLCLRMQIARATGFQMGKVREDNSSFSACPFPSYNRQVYLKMGMEANFQRASKKWLQLIMPSWMQRVLWPGFSEGLLWCSFFPTWHLQSPKRCHFLGNYFERNCNFYFSCCVPKMYFIWEPHALHLMWAAEVIFFAMWYFSYLSIKMLPIN